MKKAFFVILAGVLSAQITFAQNLSKGEALVKDMEDQDPTAIALANKYVFQDILKKNEELKKINPEDLQQVLNQHPISLEQKARLARYFDGAIERAGRSPIDNDVLRSKYENFMDHTLDPSSPYYWFWSVMYNTMVSYQTMFFWPLAMMWGAPAGMGGMYP